MQAYQITMAEYKYIHSLGIRKDAQGFTNLWGLPTKVQALREKGML